MEKLMNTITIHKPLHDTKSRAKEYPGLQAHITP
jgi:hypothetical protein